MSGPSETARRDLLATGRAAFPAIRIDDAAILAALGDRDANVHYRQDLFLSAAALAGDAQALRALDALLADIGPALRGIVPDHEIADISQELRMRMLIGRDHAKPALQGYAGRGPLRAWMRVALLRAGFDRRRQPANAGRAEVAWLAHTADASDPTVDAIRRTANAAVRAAFEQALARLPARDRLLLRQHLIDGLGATELSTIHGVHRVTTFRWLAAIRRSVLTDVRAALERELALDSSALDSLMRAMRASAVPTVERILLDDEM